MDVSKFFPPSPQVPAGLTEPSAAYKRHAWLAMAGLLGFVAVYLGLTGYLAWLLVRLGRGMWSGHNPVGAFLIAVPAGFLLVFMVRGLFLVKHTRDETLVELSRDQQPRLFAFIERLADETKAPRPHRVFLSARVNAAVFYELSFFNLIFPSRKNLELGLGLVNVLTLDELKAVVAHELGHFAQRTMAVGRWTYVASQIAGHIVASRGRMDGILNGISRVDIRIAWVGWGMRLVVWSLRALLDTVFRIVVIANRALSREMEFQADRVAVSVSGSDSLIHALHRLGAADDAWNEAAEFVMHERRSGRMSADLFAFQTRALESLRMVLDEPDYGATPTRGEGAKHRVFDEALAQPPRMWLTHPPSREREDHAKAVYVPSPLDERSAWVLLENEQQLRDQVTGALFAKLEKVNQPLAVTGTAEERFARRYSATAMSPRYRGAYLGRAIAAWDENYTELLSHRGLETPETIVSALDALYPASLRSTLAQHRERGQEEAQLEGIAEGFLTAPGGAIRYQGRELRRNELPTVLEGVRTERKKLEAALRQHDRDVRSTYLAAAKLVGHGWAEHLEGLLSLLHVATHTRRAVADEHSHLHNVLNIVLADRSVSASERSRVLSAGMWLHQTLVNAWEVHAAITLPDDVKRLFEAEGGWDALTQKLGIGAPHEQQLGEWLQRCDGWAFGAIGDFNVLGEATLNALLQAEEKVANWVRTGETPEQAPRPASVPRKYLRCCIGKERPRQKKLGWWDRFQTADGFGPGALRALVAAAVLLPVLGASSHFGSSTVYVTNGLGREVHVTIGTKSVTVAPNAKRTLSLDSSDDVHVRATIDGEVIEEFDAALGGASVDAVYNVVQSTPLVEWTALYGFPASTTVPERPIGAPRWYITRQNHVFEQPPKSVQLKKNASARHTVLEADLFARSGFALVNDPDEQRALMRAHLMFDPSNSDTFRNWIEDADQTALEAVVTRADRSRDLSLEVLLLRTLASPARQARCEKHAKAAALNAEDADLAYLAFRCSTESQQHAEVLSLAQRFPSQMWFVLEAGSALAAKAQWAEAFEHFKRVAEAPEMQSWVASTHPEILRTARASAAARFPAPSWIETLSSPTAQFLRAADGAPTENEVPTMRLARLIGRNALSEFMSSDDLKHVSADARDATMLLAGASEGAVDSLQQAALAIAPNRSNFWVGAALASRRGADVEPWLAVEARRPEFSKKVRQAIDVKALSANPAHLDELAADEELWERGVLYGCGIIALGKDAPASWRHEAKTLLFPVERPYFR